MKKMRRLGFVLMVMMVLFIVMGCDETTSGVTTEGDATTTDGTTTTLDDGDTYYLAGNFSGYIANDESFIMTPVDDRDGWYQITVELTEDVRDNAYDGHYYKVTDGTWDNAWGTDNYALQPAPESPTGGGLGSVWIYENCTLTVLFDSNTMTIYDDQMVRELQNPVISGDFSAAMDRGDDWGYDVASGLELLDEDEDGVYEGEWLFPAYDGENEDGYSLTIVVSEKYYIGDWGSAWGAYEQYLFDGSEAAMGTTSHLNPAEDTTYHFAYDSETHMTTVSTEMDQPVIYGDFSNWGFGADEAIHLEQDSEDSNLYVGTKTLPAYTGDAEGYQMAVCLSQQLYVGSWGSSWGAKEQYTFSGDPAVMGKVTYLDLEEEMTLTFSYDAETHVTSITPPEGKSVAPYEYLAGPTLYGTFTIEESDDEAFILEGEDAAVMTPVEGEEGKFEITLDLDAFVQRDSGYYLDDTGYRFVVVVTKEDTGWGYYAGEQYLFDGSPATMGAATIIDIDTAGQYHFVYDSDTHVTTYTLID